MGVFALWVSVGGAAYIGFCHWSFGALTGWAIAWGLAFVWSHRASMMTARADLRQEEEPASLPWLAYSTSILGIIALFMAAHTAAFLIASFVRRAFSGVLGG